MLSISLEITTRSAAIFSVKAPLKEYIEHTTIDFKKVTHFWEKKVIDGDCDGKKQANVRNNTRKFLV